MNSASADTVSSLSQQETAVGGLYAAFSEALPETAAFWRSLVIQENAHAEVLKKLAELCSSGHTYLNPAMFTVETVWTNIRNINNEIAKVQSGGITAIRAFSLAVDIEHSLIEMGYFRVIATDVPEMRKELQEIERHTKEHIRLVEAGLAKAKGR